MPRSLASFAALTLLAASPAAAETVEVSWTAFPPVANTTIDLQVGDSIEWDVFAGHDLAEMASQAAFDACDFTGSTILATGPTVFQTDFDTPGTHYFSCSINDPVHCTVLEMKVTVVVSEPVPIPVASLPVLAAALALAAIARLRG